MRAFLHVVSYLLSTGGCRGRSKATATMDSCCVGLRANAQLPKAGKAIKDGGVGLLGERTRGSLNQSGWADQVAKSLKVDQSRFKRKIKPGAASAIITSNNSETLVSKSLLLGWIMYFFLACCCSWIAPSLS